jgi:PAS domain S-box-containing protein
LFSLAASLVCISLGAVVYSFDRSRMLNKLFFLTCLSGFFYSFTTIMMWQASSLEVAAFWNKMGAIWPFFVVLVLHFALVFTRSSWLKNKFIFIALYVPAVTFWVVESFTDLINLPPIMEFWGYNDVASGTLVYLVSTVWSASLSILAFVVCYRYYRRAKEPAAARQQRKLVSIGLGIPIGTFVATNMFTRAANLDIPNLGIISTLFFSIFVALAITKFDLFTLDAAMAAENILSTIPDSLFLSDLNGRILRVNERLVSFLGYSEEELVGSQVAKFYGEKEIRRLDGISKELAEKRILRNQEMVLRTKGGEYKIVLFSASVVQSKTGRDIGITCVIHDITEHKAIQERLVKAERLASIGELAGQVGHDLRNPLTGIKSGAYFLRKKGNRLTESEQQSILDLIDNAVADSNRIVNSLVEYSSELHLKMEPCTPRSLVARALSKLQVPERITLRDYSTDDITLSADAPKLENAFAGIIQNAIEAIHEEGTIEIRSTLEDDHVKFTFTDTGTGMPETVLQKVFLPLNTTKAKGMGMSLAICKRIMDAHGCKASVESCVGKGTTITLVLPLKPKSESYGEEDRVTSTVSLLAVEA